MRTNFEVTIAVCPDGIKLEREMEYIKSAILYADKINLISPLAYTLLQLSDHKHSLNEHSAIELMKLVIPYCTKADNKIAVQASDVLEQLKIVRTKQYKHAPMKYKLEMKNVLLQFVKDIANVTENLIGETECKNLNTLISNKIVNVEQFDYPLSSDKCAYDFYSKLNKTIQTSYPLFDEESNNLLSSAYKNGVINLSESTKHRMKNAALTDDLVMRLPSFEMATIDELIDIKKELNNPLIRFRSKTLEYSNAINKLPWDSEFKEECLLLYDKVILPNIVELDELTRCNGFIKNLGLDLISDGTILKTTGGIVLGIATSGLIESFTEIAALDEKIFLTGGVYAAKKVADRYLEHKNKKKEIENNELFFYYASNKKLHSNFK